ncbi:phage portal protein [Methylobacterium isbiliense]|uniref:Phage portal protein n=1 Tax=Methylobacterium isbiliense TaxID=315478 RepID=A0ABQ4SGH7_9HYPH|nr:phage portal protein [Methylobacterium isbiliense]MDN3621469.1 phage portal protein [Methylobacterium isbiliense]GJE00894.1 hypothetical protein GMJLKIPL_2821 [Methylobacterium isbiliense]
MTPTITASFGSFETKAAPAASGVAGPEPWLLEMWGAVPALAGPAVTPASAMSCMPVKAAVELIAGALGTVPAGIFRSEGGGKTLDASHPAHPLVALDACPWMTAGKMREQLTTDALLTGNGVARANVVEDRVVELNPLRPGQVDIEFDPITTEPHYRVQWIGGSEVLRHDQVMHVSAPCSLNGVSGTAPIVHARQAISLALALEAHAARLFARGGRPSGLLRLDQHATSDTIKQIGATWSALNAGDQSGKTAVLPKGVLFEQLGLSSVDAQFMELRTFAIHEIARAFNVPPTLLAELSKSTLNNSEVLGRQFVQFTLLPWVQAFQDAYRRLLIPVQDRQTYSVIFDLDDLLRADSTARAALITALRSTGSATANDVRALQGLPSRPDGDRLENPYTTSNAAPAANPAPSDD